MAKRSRNTEGITGTKINKQYFSGSQVSIFIGDVWIDDITSINYNFVNNKRPFYGYGSEYFDFVTFGTKLVSGVFTVNFREPNYIWMILERERNLRGKSKEDEVVKNQEQAIEFNTFIGDKRKNYDLFFNSKNPGQTAQNFKQNLLDENKKKSKSSAFKVNHFGFDITFGYGYELNSETIGQKIIDAHIVGQNKVIMQDGRPIQEQYQFFARDFR